MPRVTVPATPKLDDPDAERVRRSHEEALASIAKSPAMGLAVLGNVSLVDATATPVAHKLGHAPQLVLPSPPRGATSTGRIEEIRDGSQDRSKVIVLKATGWGATIVVDVGVL